MSGSLDGSNFMNTHLHLHLIIKKLLIESDPDDYVENNGNLDLRLFSGGTSVDNDKFCIRSYSV